MRAWWSTVGPRSAVAVAVAAAVAVLAGGACGGGADLTSQQLGGPAAADLERAWDVTLEVVEVVPPAIQGDEPRQREYRFERGACPDQIRVEAHEDEGSGPTIEDLRSETDPETCLGSATLEVAGAVVSGVPFVAVDDTTFAVAYEARVACLDEAGLPVDDLFQRHELVWELEAADAPETLSGRLERTIRTDPGCAPPAGQPARTVERLHAVPSDDAERTEG